jgi:hypothetical protein
MPRSVADHVAEPRHAASLVGASLVGQAAGGERLLVRIGLWTDAEGRVVCARYRASTCATLIAYAEVACALLEAGVTPRDLTPDALREQVPGVHPGHRGRADLVSAAVRRARREEGSAQ